MIQVLVNAIISAAQYLMVGVGFALIYSTTRFFHFAHGIVITTGAYVVFVLKVWLGFPLWIAAIGGIASSAALGSIMELGVYRSLRSRAASAGVLLLASLGLYVAVQAVVVLVFGSGTQTIRAGNVPEGIPIFGARITVIQIFTILVSSVCCLLVWLLLRQTNIGKKLRAIACDQNLAQICGVNSETVILVAFILGSSLAGSAGILLSLDGDMNPGMGFRLLLMGMLAVIVGGVGSIPGAALGAILLGLIQNFSNWWLSSKWEDMIVFAVLVLFLLLRPQGFLGKPLGKAAA